MNESKRNPLDVAGQIAILGASEDLVTDADRGLARAFGALLARRRLACVVGGDDGVMGEAARAARGLGGTVLAVLPRGKTLGDASLFNAVIDTGLGWVQFSDALLRSARGAVAIGGGAGTLAEIAMAYLTGVPVVFLGGDGRLAREHAGRSLDDRNLGKIEVTADAGQALETLLRLSTPAAADARALADRAHFSSYPFGTGADYLPAAAGYRAANETREDVARLEDAMGDNFYYQVGDYLRAASHYLRAREELGDGQPSFAAYLKAIMLESIGMALAQVGEYTVASQVSRRSAEAYEGAIAVSPKEEHNLFLHSAAGLRGDAELFAAMSAREREDLDAARVRVMAARRNYEEALAHHPAYGDSVSSSSFARAISPVEALEAELGVSSGDG